MSDASPSPRLSIVVPNYNHGSLLRQCLDSILAQEGVDIQIIVRDGGSTDDSLDILKSYGDAIEFTSGPDAGQAAAINEGFRAARGEFIAWLNSDDYLLPGAASEALACLDAHPNVMLVYGRAWMVDHDGRDIRPYPTFEFTRDDLRRKCYVCQPTVFLRRTVLESVGDLAESLELCFDYEWWLRIMAKHEIVFCPTYLAASRHYGTTKTSARRLRGLVEAGYVLRHHFGEVPWRWAAKWVVHRWRLQSWRFMVPLLGWAAAIASATRYRRRFAPGGEPSAYGRRLLRRLEQ